MTGLILIVMNLRVQLFLQFLVHLLQSPKLRRNRLETFEHGVDALLLFACTGQQFAVDLALTGLHFGQVESPCVTLEVPTAKDELLTIDCPTGIVVQQLEQRLCPTAFNVQVKGSEKGLHMWIVNVFAEFFPVQHSRAINIGPLENSFHFLDMLLATLALFHDDHIRVVFVGLDRIIHEYTCHYIENGKNSKGDVEAEESPQNV